MPPLVWILLALGVALALTVKLTERLGRPLEPGEQARLSRILMLLVFVLLVARLLQHGLSGQFG